eukprot:gnl/TRDRNA2_/TRDRNA2_167909_c0_seq2.p1 gnl/TRDRNA2_/TRDRNA2_167909_c0~~gnl/TRDRNA2_/TRDRNA2_167909_c0_seq2.p1  ORF type:complete len:700 (-),score=171.62 gnl/TRDRNA2_/TRDRNA2_167909_c0_seq2:16-2115(-)
MARGQHTGGRRGHAGGRGPCRAPREEAVAPRAARSKDFDEMMEDLDEDGEFRAAREEERKNEGQQKQAELEAERKARQAEEEARQWKHEKIKPQIDVDVAKSKRASKRKGIAEDFAKEDEGIDEEDPDWGDENPGDVPIEPFNLRGEKQEGTFEDGYFVPNVVKRDDLEERDEWLESLEMENAAGIASKVDIPSQQQPKVEATTEEDAVTLLEKLIGELMPEETPAFAMARWGKARKPDRSHRRSKARSGRGGATAQAPKRLGKRKMGPFGWEYEDAPEQANETSDATTAEVAQLDAQSLAVAAVEQTGDQDEAVASKKITLLTELSDALLCKGVYSVYEMRREELEEEAEKQKKLAAKKEMAMKVRLPQREPSTISSKRAAADSLPKVAGSETLQDHDTGAELKQRWTTERIEMMQKASKRGSQKDNLNSTVADISLPTSARSGEAKVQFLSAKDRAGAELEHLTDRGEQPRRNSRSGETGMQPAEDSAEAQLQRVTESSEYPRGNSRSGDTAVQPVEASAGAELERFTELGEQPRGTSRSGDTVVQPAEDKAGAKLSQDQAPDEDQDQELHRLEELAGLLDDELERLGEADEEDEGLIAGKKSADDHPGGRPRSGETGTRPAKDIFDEQLERLGQTDEESEGRIIEKKPVGGCTPEASNSAGTKGIFASLGLSASLDRSSTMSNRHMEESADHTRTN